MFNGQWVRTRTTRGAKQFLAEKTMERQRVQAQKARSKRRRRRFFRRVRNWFRRTV